MTLQNNWTANFYVDLGTTDQQIQETQIASFVLPASFLGRGEGEGTPQGCYQADQLIQGTQIASSLGSSQQVASFQLVDSLIPAGG